MIETLLDKTRVAGCGITYPWHYLADDPSDLPKVDIRTNSSAALYTKTADNHIFVHSRYSDGEFLRCINGGNWVVINDVVAWKYLTEDTIW